MMRFIVVRGMGKLSPDCLAIQSTYVGSLSAVMNSLQVFFPFLFSSLMNKCYSVAASAASALATTVFPRVSSFFLSLPYWHSCKIVSSENRNGPASMLTRR